MNQYSSFFTSKFWLLLPVIYFITAFVYVFIFWFVTKKIIENKNVENKRKVTYITILSCYFYFPLIIYFLVSMSLPLFAWVFALFYIVIIIIGVAYIIYAVRRIVNNDSISAKKKALYILCSVLIWFFGYFFYYSQTKNYLIKNKYSKTKLN